MSRPDDQAIALRIHRGESKGMDQLVMTFQDALYSYALRLMNDPDEARDLTQEAFIRAYRTLTVVYDEAACRSLTLRPYLFRIVRNLALNRYRAKRRMAAAVSEAAAQSDAPNKQANPELALWLNRILQRLSHRDRELVLLRFMEGLSYDDMVAVCGSTEAAVRGKVFRAVQKLRDLANEEGIYELS